MPRLRLFSCLLTLALFAWTSVSLAQDDDQRRRRPVKASVSYDFAAESLGATPGGAQDITFFRDRVSAGEVPHPNTMTPEGLFSEHDLPLPTGQRCTGLLCVTGQAMAAELLVQPEVRYLAQLGFDSGIDASTFKRDRLHLVAVVDKSGSMTGRIDLVKESLIAALDHLEPDDAISIVLYGDRSHVHLEPTAAKNRDAIVRAIQQIAISGSTNMEAGLTVGFALARQHAKDFHGITRVMLFTDERPNVGRTDAGSFMDMAQSASKDGIGMTTIGVGIQFGAELATQISSVRGGNLFFFADVNNMKKVFAEDFDTLVTELAFDVHLVITPAKGLKITGIYGIPGDMLKWTDAGALELTIATLFLSRRKGAIYAAFASADGDALPTTRVAIGNPVGHVNLRYSQRDSTPSASQVDLVLSDSPALGLARGFYLVNQITALKAATALHHEKNDQDGAYKIMHALGALMRQDSDSTLAAERELVFKLEAHLATLAGYQGESTPTPHRDSITGLPTF